MSKPAILKDTEFEEVAEAEVDAKHRVALGRILPQQVSSYRVYRNRVGQMLLDPMVTIPASEAWLFRNKEATRLLQAGLADARKGQVVNATEDYTKYLHDKG